jgi:poly(3-hydroxybutyrate) depolymerase
MFTSPERSRPLAGLLFRMRFVTGRSTGVRLVLAPLLVVFAVGCSVHQHSITTPGAAGAAGTAMGSAGSAAGAMGEAGRPPQDGAANVTDADDASINKCAAPDAQSAPTVHPHCEASSGDCTCIATTNQAAGVMCPSADIPHPVCCAETGWPGQAFATCQCSTWGCSESPSLCICSAGSGGAASCTGNHAYCCETVLSDGTVNQCACGSFPCQNGDVQVASCSLDVITCPGKQQKVPMCSGGSGGGGGTSAAAPDASAPGGPCGSTSLASYYDQLTVVGCQKSFDCCGRAHDDPTIAGNWQGTVATREGCASAIIPTALAAEESSLADAVADGSVVYHGELASSCTSALYNESCDLFFNNPDDHRPPPCSAMFEGTLKLGASCKISEQCPSGAACVGPLSGPWTCQSVPKQGEACTGYCPTGLYCATSGAVSTCQPQKAEGSSCQPLECQGLCDYTSKTCGPPFPPACEGGGAAGSAGTGGSGAGGGSGTSGAGGSAGASGAGGSSGVGGAAGSPAPDVTAVWRSSGCGHPLPFNQVPTVTGSTTGYTEYQVQLTGATLGADDLTRAVVRTFYVRVPADYDPAKAYRTVYIFSGCGGGDIRQTAMALFQAGLGGTEEAVYVAVALPPPGTGCYDTTSPLGSQEWEAFAKMHAVVESTYCVDNNRVFAAGYSSGDVVANMWGCYFTGDPPQSRKFAPNFRIRGVAGTAGGPPSTFPTCGGPSAGIWFHDTADGPFPIANEYYTRDRVLTANGCAGSATMPWPGLPSICAQYTDCPAAFPVVFCTTTGAGHNPQLDLAIPAFTKFFDSMNP